VFILRTIRNTNTLCRENSELQCFKAGVDSNLWALNIVTCKGVRVTHKTGFGLDDSIY
jgi:hypothetical protein